MASSKNVLKIIIIVVLLVFLLSTALVSVMYLTGNKNAANETWDVQVISTGVDSMGL